MFEEFVWIQTRDGSPTLWNNSLGEPFRSFKGAFTESWTVFVSPCLEHLKRYPKSPLTVGEFGLGVGTNWVLMTAALLSLNIPFKYFTIERDLRSFHMGLKAWKEKQNLLEAFLQERGFLTNDLSKLFDASVQPKVFATLEQALKSNFNADYWFHDPFGFAVNPEGYSEESISKCRQIWSERCFGVSYACNKYFKKSLEQQGATVKIVDLEDRSLKRSRLEFFL